MIDGLLIDMFAGAGGASTGFEAGAGRPVDIAINHDPLALEVHAINHPYTVHLTADVWDVDPLKATGGRRVGALWASPDCTHFSVAKGGKPKKQNIRSLAWVVIRWAVATRPDVIFLENVREFRTWGPLDEDGRPDKARMGQTFKRWCSRLRNLGYEVDHRVLDASAYGAPTRRKRLFIIARRDGLPIVWPEPTHGPGLVPYHTAAECIDWSIPVRSIFGRKKPLAEKTLWRIWQGIDRFVINNPRPFLVKFRGDAHSADLDDPMPTILAGGRGGGRPAGAAHGYAIATPFLAKVNHGNSKRTGRREHSPLEPLTSITAQGRGHALIAPTLIQTGYGERPGQAPRALDLGKPLGTVVGGGAKHALVATFLSKGYGEKPGSWKGAGSQAIDTPGPTITTRDHASLAAVTLATFRGTHQRQLGSQSIEEPVPTISAGGIHVAEVVAFLTAFYGSDATSGQELLEPMRTIRAQRHLGIVYVEGVAHQIVDIGMRMLEPHELLRAQFGRFADGYDLSAAKTKSDKVRLIGNSVCPEIAEAIVRANLNVERLEATA